MDCYELWCDLKPGVRDRDFVDALAAWLGRLQTDGRIAGWRLMRKKLGLGPGHLGEFQVLIDVHDLAQLDEAFRAAAERSDPVEGLHAGTNQLVTNFQAALYRDFPDPNRVFGQERF